MKDGNDKRSIFGERYQKSFLRFAQGIMIPVFFILMWQYLSSIGFLNNYLLPSPLKIFRTFIELLTGGSVIKHLLISLIRLGIGLSITICMAIPLGVSLGFFFPIQKFITPTLTFLQQIPAIAWIPIFILWLGIGESSKIALIVYASFFPVFLNTLHGIQAVDPKLKEVSYAYRLSMIASIYKVYLPSAAPFIFVGIRLGLSNCWKALVAAEIIASSQGIGYLLMEGRDLAQPEQIFVSIFVIGIAGIILDLGLRRLEKFLLPWSEI